MTLGDYAAQWLRRHAAHWKPRTIETYREALTRKLLPALGPTTPLAHLTRAQVREALLHLRAAGYAASTCRLWLAILRGMLQEARVEDGLLADNPTERLGRLFPRPRGPMRLVTLGDVTERFLAAAAEIHPRLAVMFRLGLRTGLRVGELLAVQRHDIDLRGRRLDVGRAIDWRHRVGLPKGGRVADMPLSRDVVAALRPLLTGDAAVPWLFHGPSGRPYSRTHVRRILHQTCRAAGIPATSMHALRHTFLTMLAEHGESPWTIRDLARHRSITTTEAYLHLNGRHRAAVERLGHRGHGVARRHGA